MSSLAERFWSRVDRRGPDECWEWTGERLNGWRLAYGRFYVGGGRRKRERAVAHRMAWTLSYGPVPPDLDVLHRCDNPPCCNPAHLFLGTPLDNARDRDAKGRGRLPLVARRGEQAGRGATLILVGTVLALSAIHTWGVR